MDIARVIGTLVVLLAVLLALVVLTLVVLATRRRWLRHGDGKIYFCMRVRNLPGGRGWALGIARIDTDRLRWYRAYSVSPRPQRVLLRSQLSVQRRRPATPEEQQALLEGSIVLECRNQGRPIQVAVKEGAVAGFLAWLESAPPGASLPGASDPASGYPQRRVS